jgi:hypothetical protein
LIIRGYAALRFAEGDVRFAEGDVRFAEGETVCKMGQPFYRSG